MSYGFAADGDHRTSYYDSEHEFNKVQNEKVIYATDSNPQQYSQQQYRGGGRMSKGRKLCYFVFIPVGAIVLIGAIVGIVMGVKSKGGSMNTEGAGSLTLGSNI